MIFLRVNIGSRSLTKGIFCIVLNEKTLCVLSTTHLLSVIILVALLSVLLSSVGCMIHLFHFSLQTLHQALLTQPHREVEPQPNSILYTHGHRLLRCDRAEFAFCSSDQRPFCEERVWISSRLSPPHVIFLWASYRADPSHTAASLTAVYLAHAGLKMSGQNKLLICSIMHAKMHLLHLATEVTFVFWLSPVMEVDLLCIIGCDGSTLSHTSRLKTYLSL